MDRVVWLTIAMVAALLAGCPRNNPPARTAGPSGTAAEPRPSVALHVVVVNEPELVEAINRLRGEWTERSGGELSASAVTWQELSGDKSANADLIVFPSRYLGELCVRNRLRPVRTNVLVSKALDAADFFPLVRRELIKWGGQVMALPLGARLPLPSRPLGDRPAISLLAEAAPAAVSVDRLGALFDTETMSPRITEPPFVEALEQLRQSKEDTTAARPVDARRVPVIGFADRLVAVTSASHNAASAFKLLEWLATADVSSQLASAGHGTMPVRRSLASSRTWYDSSLTASERADLGKTLEVALSSEQYLIVPRIPGVDEYMTALDESVNAAVSDSIAPQAALEKAARRWEEITDAHGRDAQRQAYLKHLGISEP